MQTPREILADLWHLTGGEPSALDAVRLSGAEPQLPSSFRVDAAAQVSIAAAGLAGAEVGRWARGKSRAVGVKLFPGAAKSLPELSLRVDGKPPPPTWDPTAGI